MLARISGGKSGIVEYLIDGIKNGRDFTRNELDQRVCIDGNLDLTEAFLNAVSNDESDNYLHITLSFKEKDITTEQIKEAYEDYKDKLMSAYSKDEYNCYAEIHFPKIQALPDARTGEMRERYPHVHLVIPKTNMLTNKELNPVGLYSKIETYHDSIQESVNRKFNLSSPYDNPREMKSNADLISRYKGDNFKPATRELKSNILDRVNDSDVNTWEGFKSIVSEYGEVKETNSRKDGKYLSVKLEGDKKFTRLKESCFSEMYIQKREYKDPKPSDKIINENVDKWVNKVSHEVKHISKANPEFRKAYYSASEEDQKLILEKRVKDYESRYFQSGRRPFRKQFDFKRSEGNFSFTDNPDRLSRLPKCYVAYRGGEGRNSGELKSVLPNNAPNSMDDSRQHKYNDVRWSGNIERGGRISVATQLIKNYHEDNSKKNELELYKDIKQNLNPKYLLKELNKFNIQEKDYRYFRTKNGYRIKAGNNNLNVSDFLTKNLHLEWKETKQLLLDAYQKQVEISLTKGETNSIIFKPEIGLNNEYTVWDSINVFNYLKRKEAYEAYDMKGLDKLKDLVGEDRNEIKAKNKTLSFEEQYTLDQKNRDMDLGELVPTKNLKKKQVDYKDSLTGEKVFTDKGDRIIFNDRSPSDSAVLSGIKLAAEKYGTVKLTGTKEFKESVLEQAAQANIKVVFEPKSLHSQFIQMKEALGNTQEIVKADAMTDEQKQTQQPEQKQTQQPEQKVNQSEPVADHINTNEGKIVSFGSAKYLNKPENKMSYNVTLELADGSNHTLWGVGLNDAIKENNLQVGDKAEFKHLGVQRVEVMVDVFDDHKNKIGEELKEVNKNVWEADNIERKVVTEEIKEPVQQEPVKQAEQQQPLQQVQQEPVQQQQQEPEQQQQEPFYSNSPPMSDFDSQAQYYAEMLQSDLHSADTEAQVNGAYDDFYSNMVSESDNYQQFDNSNFDNNGFDNEPAYQQPEQVQQAPIENIQPVSMNNGEIQDLVNKAIDAINEARNNPDDFDAELNEADAYTLADKAGQKSFEAGVKENPFTDNALAEQFNNGYSNAQLVASKQSDQAVQNNQSAVSDQPTEQASETNLPKGYYRINYKWNGLDKAYEARINGEPLSDKVTSSFIDNLRKNDAFLSNFSKEDITSGVLKADQVKNGVAPKGYTVNEFGDKTSLTDSDKQKQSLSM